MFEMCNNTYIQSLRLEKELLAEELHPLQFGNESLDTNNKLQFYTGI